MFIVFEHGEAELHEFGDFCAVGSEQDLNHCQLFSLFIKIQTELSCTKEKVELRVHFKKIFNIKFII